MQGDIAMAGEQMMRINGAQVAVHGHFRRESRDAAGNELIEYELTVMIRGRMPNKQFVQHMSNDRVRLELIEGTKPATYFMWITNHTSAAGGSGEATVYRHDISLREDPEGAKQRRALLAQTEPKPEPVAIAAPIPVSRIDESSEISDVRLATSAASWGDAIRQMKGETITVKAREDRLSLQELLAVEIVLTNLRIDAMIDQMEGAGILRRSSVNARFKALIEDRFVEDVTHLVGEKAAKLALEEM